MREPGSGRDVHPSPDEIRRYWDERAADASGAPAATTNDVWLRRIEVGKLVDQVRRLELLRAEIVDVGCGDGRTAIALARQFPQVRVVGVDFSPQMVRSALERLESVSDADASLGERVRFIEGDVSALEAAIGERPFDVAITDRCLINLPSWNDQRRAIGILAGHLRPGGHYFAIENFIDGHQAMNALRREQGLPEIDVRWHNRLLDERAFLEESARWFDVIEVDDFTSTYYLVTRVVYAALCAREGTEPDYEHPIHEIAASLPPVGRFSPIRLVRMRRLE